MADFQKMVPFIIKWETGVIAKNGEDNETLFERARTKGYANDKLDKGGATQTGVTLNTYKSYCKAHKISTPTTDNLKQIPYSTWLNILKELYWDRWRADKIVNQSVANICVDWVWASGKYGVTKVQELLGVEADGIVGPKTLQKLNSKAQLSLFAQIQNARIKFVERLVARDATQKKWLNGWKRRIMDIKYSEG